MPTLTLRFVRGRNMIARAIQWRAWGHWSHVEAVVPGGYLGARWPHGVTTEPVGYDAGHLADKAFRHAVVTPAGYAAAMAWAASTKGAAYDVLGDLGFVVRADWHNPRRFFCSEWSWLWIFKAGVQLLYTDTPWKLSPSDLWLSPPSVLLPGPG